MSTKMFNKKTAMVAGTALTTGLAIGAMQEQNVQTVHADTIDNTQTDQANQDLQTNVQEAQANYNQQKEIVANASVQAQSAQKLSSESKAKLDQVTQNVNDLQKEGNIEQTQQKITQQSQVVTNTEKSASQAAENAKNHQAAVTNAQTAYDQANTAQEAQASRAEAADQAAQEAESKIDQKKADQLTKAHTDAQNKVDQDMQQLNQINYQTEQDQNALDQAKTQLDPAQEAANDANAQMTAAQDANDQAQQAKSEQLNQVSQKQVAYDQEYGLNGTLGNLEKQVAKNVDYENAVNLPFTLAELRAANDESTDTNWDETVKKSEAAYNQDNNTFKSESAADDGESVDPKNLTPAQERELSNYTLRIINNAREQLGLPDWTYGLNTQSLADDIAADYDEHNRSNRQGHYVEGIVREANKHGLAIDNNYVEDMYSFYAPLDKPMTMTQVKEALYNNLKGMILGNVCNPGSTPEYHHANALLADGDSSYALSISNQKEDDHDFATTHYINVSSGIVDYSKSKGGTWETDPDANKEINDQITQLKDASVDQLNELNGLKSTLNDLNQKAMNTEVAYTSAKNAYDQAAKNLQAVQDQIDAGQSALTNDNDQLDQAKQDLSADQTAMAQARDALDKFNQENELFVQDYQNKAAAAKQEHQTLSGLKKTTANKKADLDQVTAEQNKLDQLANEAQNAVKTAKKVLAKHQAHLTALKQALQSQNDQQQDYQAKAKNAAELVAKLNSEQANLKQAESNLTQAQKLVELANQNKPEPGDTEVILPEEKQQNNQAGTKDSNNKQFVVSDDKADQVIPELTYTVKGDTQQDSHDTDNSRRIVIKNNNVNINNSFNHTKKIVKKVYVPVINHNRNWRVNLYNGQGQQIEQTIATDSTWQVLEQMLIGTQWYYRIGDGQWIPEKYVQVVSDNSNSGKTTPEQIFKGIAHVIATSGMIPLLDANGNFTGKFINPGTSWKVWAIKWINGQEMVRIGNENQWVAMKYIAELDQD